MQRLSRAVDICSYDRGRRRAGRCAAATARRRDGGRGRRNGSCSRAADEAA
ncbi:MAG: hypothetical protein MZV65_44520 [Chromatiales bacterium]|nr:hypothetical protein [Chromatiales bacterium]